MAEEPCTEQKGAKRGPKPDLRAKLDVRVQPEVFGVLDSLQRTTGMPADENAAMLLHMLVTEPETVASRLRCLFGENKEAPAADERPSLLPRSRMVS